MRIGDVRAALGAEMTTCSRFAHLAAVSHLFDEPGEFFDENKRLGMPATGTSLVGDTTYDFGEGETFGVLDWGRGVWPDEVRWEWGHFTGMTEGHLVGINLGTVNGDDTPGAFVLTTLTLRRPMQT